MTVRYISHVICALQLPKPLDNEDKFLKKREKKTLNRVIRDTRERTEQKSYVNHISLYRLDQINTS